MSNQLQIAPKVWNQRISMSFKLKFEEAIEHTLNGGRDLRGVNALEKAFAETVLALLPLSRFEIVRAPSQWEIDTLETDPVLMSFSLEPESKKIQFEFLNKRVPEPDTNDQPLRSIYKDDFFIIHINDGSCLKKLILYPDFSRLLKTDSHNLFRTDLGANLASWYSFFVHKYLIDLNRHFHQFLVGLFANKANQILRGAKGLVDIERQCSCPISSRINPEAILDGVSCRMSGKMDSKRKR